MQKAILAKYAAIIITIKYHHSLIEKIAIKINMVIHAIIPNNVIQAKIFLNQFISIIIQYYVVYKRKHQIKSGV
ncbi:MAG: hypothetical protein ACRC42_02635 [Mycoplasma sp.]